MDAALTREYRRIRAEQPFLPARQAILWARGILSPSLPEGVEEVDRNHGADTVLAEGETEGFQVRITASLDEYSEPRGTFTDTWSEEAVPVPDWRPGMSAYRSVYRYFVPESGETLATLTEGFRAQGMSKSNARLRALASLRTEVRMAAEPESYVVTARVSRAGVVLATESLHGCDADPDARWSVTRGYLLETGAEVLSEALYRAREVLADLVENA